MQRTLTFLTCGHVDDGKSTLIGRLLHDIGVIPPDQLAAATSHGALDFSRLTDGLEDEIRQGITIDVAYRFFVAAGQRYRIADTPGHLEYVRNMAVAAADSDIALILIDATHGIRAQTASHSRIAAWLGIKRFIVVVNKIDAVDYSEKRFKDIVATYNRDVRGWDDVMIDFIPVSALLGDNITTRSPRTPWYTGQALWPLIQAYTAPSRAAHAAIFPVQHIARADGQRWLLGTLASGVLKQGDTLHCLTSHAHAKVNSLQHSGVAAVAAQEGQAIALTLDDELDISRGTVLTTDPHTPLHGDSFAAQVLWLDKGYAEKHTFQGTIKLHHSEQTVHVTIQDAAPTIKPAIISLGHAVTAQAFAKTPRLGLFLLLDSFSDRAVGVGAITHAIGDSLDAAAGI